MNCNDVVRRLPRLSPSVQSVLCTLVGHPPLTGQQIREQTGLPRRTVYGALKTLRALGILKERVSLKDTRQTYFWLAEDKIPVQPPPATLPGGSADTEAWTAA